MSDTDDILSDSDNEETELEEEIIAIEGDIVDSNSDSDSDGSDTSLMYQFRYIPEPNPDQERIIDGVERIYNMEYEFLDTEKENHKYYLGLSKILVGNKRLLLNIAIQPQTFLKFDIQSVLNYLAEYSIFHIHREVFDTSNLHLEIMKLEIAPNSQWQTVILKTFWIRIIQRTWKRIFRERQETLLKRRTLQNLRNFELRGKHLPNIHVLPTMYGMLCHQQ